MEWVTRVEDVFTLEPVERPAEDRFAETLDKLKAEIKRMVNTEIIPALGGAILKYAVAPTSIGLLLGVLLPPKIGMRCVYGGWICVPPAFLWYIAQLNAWKIALFAAVTANAYSMVAVSRLVWQTQ